MEGKTAAEIDAQMQLPVDTSDLSTAPDQLEQEQSRSQTLGAAPAGADPATADAETERLLKEYLEQTEKLADARYADRGRQSEAVKAKLAAK